jgi:hypothetical protein
MWEGFSFVDHLCFAVGIQQIYTVYQRHNDITHGKGQGCQLEELLRESINSLFLLRFPYPIYRSPEVRYTAAPQEMACRQQGDTHARSQTFQEGDPAQWPMYVSTK